MIRTVLGFSAALTLLAACGPKPAPAPGASIAPASAEKAGTLEWAVAGAWRLPVEKARDAARRPAETLAFFGVQPGHVVVELWPGGGYYTAILGPYLKRGGGRLIAAHMQAAPGSEAEKSINTWRAAFLSDTATFGTIEMSSAGPASPGVAPDGTADAVLTFRNIHNWMAGGYADKIFADAFRALKPGGVLGVEEHRLPSNRDQDPTAATGYVKESYVIQLAQAAGFVLEARSEINANPKDDANHPVWMLPPNLRPPAPGSALAEGYDRAKYEAIGESDRMTLRFRKPDPNAPAPAAAATTPAP